MRELVFKSQLQPREGAPQNLKRQKLALYDIDWALQYYAIRERETRKKEGK
jgi:glutamine synthetase adenylyltransferase